MLKENPTGNRAMKAELEKLEGVIERIVYVNEENHYTVMRLKVPGRRDPATAVGYLTAVHPGESVLLLGSWELDRKFGEQFKVDTYETVKPSSLHGIQKYLASGLIDGIGKKLAESLVETFGTDTLRVIEEEPERLLAVAKIGPHRLKAIKKAWAEQREVTEVMVFLQGHGVSSGFAARILRTYGQESITVIQENPYRLAFDIHGVGFKTADHLAGNLGIPQNSLIRAEAGLVYTLQQLMGEGHVCYPQERLLSEAQEILGIDWEIIERALELLVKRGEIVRHRTKQDEITVYLKGLFIAERESARRLKRLISFPRRLPEIKVDRAIAWVEEKEQVALAPEQQEAFYRIMEHKVVVITGGPGTGKTTLINSLLKVLQAKKLRVELCAPTGRAARRMSESSGAEAKTIHRLLEFSPKDNRFQRNEHHPLETDFLVIDEMSMVDISLWHHLLKAVPAAASLILVGDRDQLPSVGPGNLLRDLVDAHSVPVVTLRQVFRQAKESSIVSAAHQINQGLIPAFPEAREEKADLFFMHREEPQDMLEAIRDLCTRRLPQRYGFNPREEIQVISPMHRGEVGVENLNRELQAALNPSGPELTRGVFLFRAGDRVMQMVNNYDKEVFNGDVGRITYLDHAQEIVRVRFPDRTVTYDFSEVDELMLAYAVSVHKSQGSEYPCVIIPLTTKHYVMLQRNLIYTALTRGRRLAVLVGTKKALSLAINNDKLRKRYTNFQEFLESSQLEKTDGELFPEE